MKFHFRLTILSFIVISFAIVIAILAACAAGSLKDGFECNDFNNDCRGCVQMAENTVSQCAFCPKDGMCHTVGSLFDKCSSSECISVSVASQCKNDDIHDCDNAVKHYADVGVPSNSTAEA